MLNILKTLCRVHVMIGRPSYRTSNSGLVLEINNSAGANEPRTLALPSSRFPHLPKSHPRTFVYNFNNSFLLFFNIYRSILINTKVSIDIIPVFNLYIVTYEIFLSSIINSCIILITLCMKGIDKLLLRRYRKLILH